MLMESTPCPYVDDVIHSLSKWIVNQSVIVGMIVSHVFVFVYPYHPLQMLANQILIIDCLLPYYDDDDPFPFASNV